MILLRVRKRLDHGREKKKYRQRVRDEKKKSRSSTPYQNEREKGEKANPNL